MCFGSYEDDVREGYGAEWMKCVADGCMLSALKIQLWIARIKVASAHIELMDYDLLSLAHLTLLCWAASKHISLYFSCKYNYQLLVPL